VMRASACSTAKPSEARCRAESAPPRRGPLAPERTRRLEAATRSAAWSADDRAGYQGARGRMFSVEEREVAWAASIWPALYNAREEILHAVPSVALTALDQQTDRRLSLAGA
jgi:hypothetical protein